MNSSSPDTEITGTELKAKLDANVPIVVLETLTEAHYLRGHLPRARLMPHTQVRQLAAEVAPDKSSDIVVYCANRACRNSHVAAAVLTSLGYQNVRVFAGGKEEWKQAGFPFEG
jgi:rhodanese-related sulfurtransferase